MVALYIIGGIVILLIILALLAPKEARVERSIIVNVPPEKAYHSVKSWNSFVTWSPWAEHDPNLEYGFQGDDGEVGSTYWWKGNKVVGEGEMEIKSLQQPNEVKTELRFFKPFQATNAGWFKIQPEGEGAKVSWGFHAEFKLPTSIFMLFMNMEKGVGSDFEKGLAKFKNMVENS